MVLLVEDSINPHKLYASGWIRNSISTPKKKKKKKEETPWKELRPVKYSVWKLFSPNTHEYSHNLLFWLNKAHIHINLHFPHHTKKAHNSKWAFESNLGFSKLSLKTLASSLSLSLAVCCFASFGTLSLSLSLSLSLC